MLSAYSTLFGVFLLGFAVGTIATAFLALRQLRRTLNLPDRWIPPPWIAISHDAIERAERARAARERTERR